MDKRSDALLEKLYAAECSSKHGVALESIVRTNHTNFMFKTARILSVALVTMTFACAPQTEEQDDSVVPIAADEEGWQVLFDGETFEGWRGYQSEEIPPGWSVVDGTIRFKRAVEEEDQHIITTRSFDHFELSLEWSIEEAGNSGIIYLAQIGDYGNPYDTGLEMQVLDDNGHEDALNGPDRIAGALYDIKAPSGARQLSNGRWTTDYVKGPGEWNEVRIIVDSTHVEHWLNGVKAVEIDMWSDEWNERLADSKWPDYPDFGKWTSGHIALQDHEDEVWYRNIRIRSLLPGN
jgi:hypothetical protein